MVPPLSDSRARVSRSVWTERMNVIGSLVPWPLSAGLCGVLACWGRRRARGFEEVLCMQKK